MRYTCLHTHSDFCDGKGEIESFCRAAWEKGLAAIGFSSHAPIAKKTGLKTDWHLPDERLNEYIDAVHAARRRWAGKLPVYLGLEVDYIKGLSGPADRDFQELGLDYIIGSVHYVFPPKGGEPFTVDSPREEFEADIKRHFDGDGAALIEAYWDSLKGMIAAGGFDILGHLDLVKKNNPNREWFSPESEAYKRRIRDIAVSVGKSGAVTELNTGGLNRGSTREPYPSPELLGLLRLQNVPVIITADAHAPEHLGGYYGLAQEILAQAGYTKTAFFEGKKDGKTVWSEEIIGQE
ncbi:histidinol phosphate phosphatase, HisJ [Treponema primitia ZAS-2]|uniref:Histidinol-phosphatase n=1 Tax=Treponema primitia (strain ATCC BAA-887 / DSM 12427 / ZAS-2) TaxID=545694 RepID=F5YQH0_TREPZ|nr:histidinol-phosphatase [Treponema primitia]AEF85593.1 histidinol phosphate phosphatase, HisJ [Treponema primitia ZAS-2]